MEMVFTVRDVGVAWHKEYGVAIIISSSAR
jgi:hypothetical protein